MNQYLSMFIDESRDHLQAMNESLLNLEQSPQDIGIVQIIFRSAHTLKGMSATMGYDDIASLTHQMENVLDLVRNNKLDLNGFIFECLFKSTDALESMVDDIIGGGTGKADVGEIVNSLKSIVSGDYPKQAGNSSNSAASASSAVQLDEYQYSVLEQSMSGNYNVFYIEVAVRDDCVLKAARAYMVFKIFEEYGEVIKSYPTVDEIEQEKFEKLFSVYFISRIPYDQLQAALSGVSEIEYIKIMPLDRESLKELSRSVHEASATNQHIRKEASEASIQSAAAALPAAKASASQPTGTPVANRTIRVDIERLDTLMNLFSELLIDRVRLEQLAGEIRRSDLTDTVEHLSRVGSDLQNIVLKLRMVPIDTVFNRFPRMIRDVAKSLGKKIDLVITGADTELDRTVVDEIGDPLVHLLRNAGDHGLETTEERKAAGKPETGTINLRAFHSGNHVFIEIEDDGAGINREKVLKIALKNGVVTPEQAEKITEQEIDQLLFASGFSTADKISDLSGRGVGLDVVKTKIQSLGGHVYVESKRGQGSRFSVQLPLTLSIISAMLVRVENEKYAIPLSSIVETASFAKDKIRSVHGNLLVDYRGSVVPLIPLSQVFDVPAAEQGHGSEQDVVIIRKGDKLAAVQVDEFVGQHEIVLKTLGSYLSNIFAVSGATILGDGQVALIIDTNALIK